MNFTPSKGFAKIIIKNKVVFVDCLESLKQCLVYNGKGVYLHCIVTMSEIISVSLFLRFTMSVSFCQFLCHYFCVSLFLCHFVTILCHYYGIFCQVISVSEIAKYLYIFSWQLAETILGTEIFWILFHQKILRK